MSEWLRQRRDSRARGRRNGRNVCVVLLMTLVHGALMTLAHGVGVDDDYKETSPSSAISISMPRAALGIEEGCDPRTAICTRRESDDRDEVEKVACAQCQRNGEPPPSYTYKITYCLYLAGVPEICSLRLEDRRTEIDEATGTCPSKPCVDCKGEWREWRGYTYADLDHSYLKHLPYEVNLYDTYDREHFCGVYESYRVYEVTTEQGPNGSYPCPHSNDEFQYNRAAQEKCEPLRVEIGNPLKFIASNTFDFDIRVYHDKLCGQDTPCHASTQRSAQNVMCDAVVKKKDGAQPTNGDISHLPYKKLKKNFIDPETNSRVIRLTTDGALVAGDYVVDYNCSIRHYKVEQDDEIFFKMIVTDVYNENNIKGSHEFSIFEGCEHELSLDSDKELLATHLFLTSPEFITAKCDALIDTKEALFRKYDTSPTDGLLDIHEIINVLQAHGADGTKFVSVLSDANTTTIDAGGTLNDFERRLKSVSLTLGEVLKARVTPHHCDTSEDKQAVKIKKVTSPTVVSGQETTRGECESGAQNIAVHWDFHEEMDAGDAVCVYVDATLTNSNTPTKSEPAEGDGEFFTQFSKNGFYALSGAQDKRQIFGRKDDVQATLLAQFTFDGHGLDAAKTVFRSDLKWSSRGPYNDDTIVINDSGTVAPCKSPMSGRCLQTISVDGTLADGSVQHIRQTNAQRNAFTVVYEAPGTAFAWSMWVFLPTSKPSLCIFFRSYGAVNSGEFLDVGIHGGVLGVRHYRHGDPVKTIEMTDELMFAAPGWYLIGFAFLERNQGVSIFSYPMNKTKSATVLTSPDLSFEDVRGCFRRSNTMAGIGTQFQLVGMQFDDIRMYSGVIRHETLEAIRQCGGRAFCARMARTAPGTRRVICVTNRVKGESSRRPACASSIFYDGTAMDIRPSMDIAGVQFSFRDTAWDETGFEIERSAHIVSGGEGYETVVSIGSNLKGCASVFSSITYLDREAAEIPYTQWTYRIVSKFDRELPNGLQHLVSSPVHFTTPWVSSIVGNVFAGGSTTPVPYVRVCAEFKKKIDDAAVVEPMSTSQVIDLARNKRVSYSYVKDAGYAHVVTSTTASGYVSVPKDEFLRVDLGAWSSVESISVCVVADANVKAIEHHVQAYVHDTEADLNSKSHGHECLYTSPQWTHESSGLCAKFSCFGSVLKSFHGQFVDIVSTTTLADAVKITKVQVFGNETKCRFAATTDKDGGYELSIQDFDLNIPIKSKLHIGAYKEEIHAQESVLTNLDGVPENIFFYFKNTSYIQDISREYNTGLKKSGPIVDWDDQFPDRTTVEEQFAKVFLGEFDSASMVITEAIWNQVFDIDRDGKVQADEVDHLLAYTSTEGAFSLEPLIVLPLMDAKDMTPKPFGKFQALASASGCEHLLLLYQDSQKLPKDQTGWQEFYRTSIEEHASVIRDVGAKAKCHEIEKAQPVNTTVVGSPSDFILPVLIWFPDARINSGATTLRLAPTPLNPSKLLPFEDKVTLSMQLITTYRRPDIVHVFDKPPTMTQTDGSTESSDATAEVQMIENIFSTSAMTKRTIIDVKHKRIEEKDFTDDTTVTVQGAILFPSSRVDGSTACGLSSATIEVIDTEGNVLEHKTDSKGHFKLALTRGKTFELRAKYQGHFICYAGDTVESAVNGEKCAELENEDYVRLQPGGADKVLKKFPHDAHRLVDVSNDHFVYFTDVTRSKIDLGVYQGECEGMYSGVKYLIQPTNGCHAALTLDHDTIVQDTATGREPGTYFWPFAAMKYTIKLIDAPSVGSTILEHIEKQSYASGCTRKDDVHEIQTYFKEKAEDVKVVNMQDEVNGASARYKYHGHFCVDVMDIPAIDDENLKCYDEAEPAGALSYQHFLGTTKYTDFAQNIDGTEKLVRVQVFEVHLGLDANKVPEIKTCATFPSKDLGTGSTMVQFRQDVSDEENNPCHSTKAGGPLCDFALQSDSVTKQLLFPLEGGGSQDAASIALGKPNLVAPYRRNVHIQVTRDDNWTPVSLKVKRHLIPLGGKLRGSKYELSDDTYWATVPIDGLVYTVVHDPPGGDSYAELATESRIGLDFELAGDREVSSNRETYSKSKNELEYEINPGVNAGFVLEAELSTPIKMLGMKSKFNFGTSGPKFTISSTESEGWSLETTTNRALRSSQDVALPGRAGDAILGGGIELVYKMSDVLDVQMDGSSKDCLLAKPYITWLPRKPTSYVFIVATIEQQVLPNLRFLLSTVLAGRVSEDKSDMAFPCKANGKDDTAPIGNCTQEEIVKEWIDYLAKKVYSWEKTLQWSSPSIFTLVKDGGERVKSYEAVERVSKPMLDGASVFGENLDSKTKFFTKTLIDTPIKDVVEDLGKTWDATFWILPFNGLGPPPMFGGVKYDMFNALYPIPEYYWEPEKDVLDAETPAETLAKMHGKEPKDFVAIVAKPFKNVIMNKLFLNTNSKKPGYWDLAKDSGKQTYNMWKDYGKTQEQWDAAVNAQVSANRAKKIAKEKKQASQAAKGANAVADDVGDEVKKLTKQGKTSTKATALKVLAAGGILAGYLLYKDYIQGKTYPYISYPRELYRDSVPTAQSAFYDEEEYDVLKPYNGTNKMYSWGMMTSSVDDLMSTFYACPHSAISCTEAEYKSNYTADQLLSYQPWEGGLGEDKNISPEYEDRVVASFTGGKAMTGMKVRGATGVHEDAILLTFSGGGHAVEFSFSSDEAISSNHYELHVNLHAEGTNKHNIEWSGLLGFPIQAGLAVLGIDDKQTWTFTKDMSSDRTFNWNKHGKLSTLYSLGDPHLGDKFVVHVASDTRFGTPVFITKGGRSLCPGEPFTIWREASIAFMPLESTELRNLHPDDRAILVLSIKNEAMHREAAPLGLRLVDGLIETVHKIVDVAYANADAFREAKDVLKGVLKVAENSVARDAPVVKKMVKAARDAVDAKKTAFEAAVEVNDASADAPALGSEMHDLEFLVMNEWLPPLGDVVPLKFLDGDSLRSQQHVRETSFTMSIGRGPTALSELKYIRLQLVSLCEFDLSESRNFNREPIGDTISLGTISWLTTCPKVSFTKSTLETHEATQYISKQSREKSFEFGVEFDASADNLQKVLLQYRRHGEEWQAWSQDGNAVNLLKTDFDKSQPFKWDINDNHLLSGSRDGEYEVRVRSICRGGSNAIPSTQFAVTDATLTLVVDTTPPLAIRKDVFDDHTYSIVFSEPIDCSSANVRVTNTHSKCDARGPAIKLDKVATSTRVSNWQCGASANVISVSFLDEAVGTYAVEITNIKDFSANAMEMNALSFNANVHCTGTTLKRVVTSTMEKFKKAISRHEARKRARKKKKPKLGTYQSICAMAAVFLMLCSAVVAGGAKIARRRRETSTTQASRTPAYGATV